MNSKKPMRVQCILTYVHPVRKQEKVFIKWDYYYAILHALPEILHGRLTGYRWTYLVYKYYLPTTRLPDLKTLGPNFLIGVNWSQAEFLERFKPFGTSDEISLFSLPKAPINPYTLTTI